MKSDQALTVNHNILDYNKGLVVLNAFLITVIYILTYKVKRYEE